MTVAPKAYKFPKSFGACADKLNELRQKRLEQEKIAAVFAAEESALREHIIANLPKSEGGAIGKEYKVQVIMKVVPRVEDWEKFYAYIAKFKRFDMLQRRPSDAAIQELWDDKKKVPGVVQFQAVTLSLTKR